MPTKIKFAQGHEAGKAGRPVLASDSRDPDVVLLESHREKQARKRMVWRANAEDTRVGPESQVRRQSWSPSHVFLIHHTESTKEENGRQVEARLTHLHSQAALLPMGRRSSQSKTN